MNNADKNLKRLMDKTVNKNGCLEFTGGIGSHGYGVFHLNGKNQNAHKASYLLHYGEIKGGLWVLHNCDNKKCINPKHLYLGDRNQNTRDAVQRKRMASGINHGIKTHPNSFKRCNSVFSDSECIEIKNSNLCKKALSEKYNVHISTIYRAIEYSSSLLAQLETTQY